jgi:hypothetical protein
MKSMGYWVIEWPIASRDKLRTKAALSAIGKRIKGAFQALGYNRGLRRWHFFGEKGERGWNPHINVIVDGLYLSKSKLRANKKFLRMVLNEPQLIIHYEYRSSVAEMVHTLKYTLRATFLDKSWDERMSYELFDFQNANVWGGSRRWADPPAWEMDKGKGELDAVEKLESGICPECGKPIHWTKPIEICYLELQGAVPIGGGYFRLPDIPPPMRKEGS